MENGADATTGTGTGATPGSSPRPAPTLPTIPSVAGGDWPAQAADAIVSTVDKVRDRTTVPLMKLARASVFGVFIGTFVIVLCTLVIVGLVRLLDEAQPWGVWFAYLVLGIVVTGLGWLLFRKRNEASAEPAGKNSAR